MIYSRTTVGRVDNAVPSSVGTIVGRSHGFSCYVTKGVFLQLRFIQQYPKRGQRMIAEDSRSVTEAV